MSATWMLGIGIRLVGNEFATGMQRAGRDLNNYMEAARRGLQTQERELEGVRRASSAASREVSKLQQHMRELRLAKPIGDAALSQTFKTWRDGYRKFQSDLREAQEKQRSLLTAKDAAAQAKAGAKAQYQPHLDALKQIREQISKVQNAYQVAIAPMKQGIAARSQAFDLNASFASKARRELEQLRLQYAPQIRKHAEVIASFGRQSAEGKDAQKSIDGLRVERDAKAHPLRVDLATRARIGGSQREDIRRREDEIAALTAERDAKLTELRAQRDAVTNRIGYRTGAAQIRGFTKLVAEAEAKVTAQREVVRNAQNALSGHMRDKPLDAMSAEMQQYQQKLATARQELVDKQAVATQAKAELGIKQEEVREAKKAFTEQRRAAREALMEAKNERRRTMLNAASELMMMFGMLRGGARRLFGAADAAADFQYQARGLSSMINKGDGAGAKVYAKYAAQNAYQQEVSPTEAMARMRQLAAAGYTPGEIPSAVAAIMDTTTAAKGEISQEGAFQLGINLHRNFGGRYRSMKSVLDTAVMASNKSPMTIGQIADAAGYGVEAASQLGQSEESMLATLGILMPVAKTASRTGTVYRNTALSLAKPQNQEMLANYGVDVKYGSNNKVRDIMDIMLDLNDKFAAVDATNQDPKFRQRAAQIEAELAQIKADQRHGRIPKEERANTKDRADALKAELKQLGIKADITPTRMLKEQLQFQFGGQRGGAIFAAIQALTKGSAANSLENTALEGYQFKSPRAAWEAMRSGMAESAGEARRLADDLRDTSKVLKDQFNVSLEKANMAIGELVMPFADAMRRMGKRGLDWVANALGGAPPGQTGGSHGGAALAASGVAAATAVLTGMSALRFGQMLIIANRKVAAIAAAQGLIGSGLGSGIGAGFARLVDAGGMARTAALSAGMTTGSSAVAGLAGVGAGLASLLLPLTLVLGPLILAVKSMTDTATDFSAKINQQDERNKSMFMSQMDEYSKYVLGEDVNVARLRGRGMAGKVGATAYGLRETKGMNPLQAMEEARKNYLEYMNMTNPEWAGKNQAAFDEEFQLKKQKLADDILARGAKSGMDPKEVEAIRAMVRAEYLGSLRNDPFSLIADQRQGGADLATYKGYLMSELEYRNSGTLGKLWRGPLSGVYQAYNMGAISRAEAQVGTPDQIFEKYGTSEALETFFESLSKKVESPELSLSGTTLTELTTGLADAMKKGDDPRRDAIVEAIKLLGDRLVQDSPITRVIGTDGVPEMLRR